MMRISSKLWATVAALVIVALVSQGSMAQREGRRDRGDRGGRGGPGGPVSMARLATIDKVQDTLKLTDEQKDKIKKINEAAREEMGKMFRSGERPDFDKIRKMSEHTSAKLNEVLDDAQQKRLMGILIQVNPAGAINDPAVAKELSITDEQKTKLRETMRGMREGRGQGPPSPDDRRARMEKIEKDMMAVLTADQQKKLESLKGEKVEIDMSQLRGFGRSDRPGRGEGRDRTNRSRDASTDKKSSA
jgi:Spy/CpxP family protein refolding chaperone